MKLKIKILLTLWILFLSSFAFAESGIGAAFSYSASTSPHALASFTARSDISPWVVFFNAHLDENTISIFADDWFINERLGENLDYFLLWGINAGLCCEDDLLEIGTGCRFGMGLDFLFSKRRIEFFLQAVWNPYFGIEKEDGDYSPFFRPVNFPCSSGLRIWF